jgi:TolA-binding protein
MMVETRCLRSERDGDFQSYLGKAMGEAETEAFELHYMECGDCFEALEDHRAIRAAASSSRSPGVFARRGRAALIWTGVAAAVVLTIGVSLARRTTPGIVSPSDGPAAASPRESESTTSRTAELNGLARFDPPPYRPVASRAADSDAGRAFREAMRSYQAGDFATAARQLRAAGAGAHAEETRFFLGISELRTGDVDAGIADLRAVVALGDTAYFEEGAFFLAKALLGRADVDGAEQVLQRLVATNGDRARDAGQLLARVRQLPPR